MILKYQFSRKQFGMIIGVLLVAAIVFINYGYQRFNEQAVLTEFNSMMAEEAVTAAELIQYLDENLDQVSPKNAATMVLGLEQIQKAKLSQWQEQYENEALQQAIGKVYFKDWAPPEFDNIEADEVQQLLVDTVNNGYKVETAEGFYFPVIDYAVYQKYSEQLPPDLVAYFEIMKVESDETPIKDAALVISWSEIFQRALRQEEFLKQYPNSSQFKAVKTLLKRYLTFALYGANNTPLFSYDTRQMNPEAKEAFLQLSLDEEQGAFSHLIKGYLEVLERSQYRLTSEVDVYRNKAEARF